MRFGPADENEAVIFATEELRADIQYDILRAMKDANVSKAELARRLKVSPAWVSQILGDEANLTIETIARIYCALGSRCEWHSMPAKEAVLRQGSWSTSAPVAKSVGWATADEVSMQSNFIEVEAVSMAVSTTTNMLMKLIEKQSRKSPPMVVNDNLSEKLFEQAVVA